MSYTPVWFMRQAGRSLPEYHKVREGIPMLESCTRPELVTEITLQPLRRYDVDAAVLFSDIVVPLRAVGVDVDIKAGIGPVVDRPFREAADVERLRPLEAGDVPYITEAVRALVAELGDKPLIGFAGGPFTLASYLIDGGPSKNHDRTKALMYGNPALWHALLGKLADIAIAFLKVQIEAGAAAVQLFDSWVGAVSPEDYRQAIFPHTSRIFAALAAYDVPRIHFGVGTGELLGLLGEAGRGRRRRRLAGAARRGGPPGPARQGPAGEPGPGGPAGPVGCRAGPDPRGADPRPQHRGPHLQPGPRRPSRGRPVRLGEAGRPRPRRDLRQRLLGAVTRPGRWRSSRYARPSAGDARAMAELFAAVAGERDGIATEPPVDIAERAAQFAATIAGSVVAVAGGQLVGMIHVEATRHGFGEIGMCVDRDWRGRGVGSALMRAAISLAREQGLHKLSLEVFAHNAAAIALYRRAASSRKAGASASTGDPAASSGTPSSWAWPCAAGD